MCSLVNVVCSKHFHLVASVVIIIFYLQSCKPTTALHRKITITLTASKIVQYKSCVLQKFCESIKKLLTD